MLVTCSEVFKYCPSSGVWNLARAAMYHVGLCLCCLIRGTRLDGGPACLRKGWCKSSTALVLCAGSRTNILYKKPCSWGDTFKFFSLGGGMSLILLIACSGGSLKNGGSPSTISITIIPRDQISTSGP